MISPERCEGRGAAGHAEGLHHVDARIDDELAGLVDLPEHVNLVAFDFLHRHGHDRVGDEFLQPVGHGLLQLADRLAARIDLARERKRERAVRAHQHGALQVRLLPDGDGEHVAGLHGVFRILGGHGTGCTGGQEENDDDDCAIRSIDHPNPSVAGMLQLVLSLSNPRTRRTSRTSCRQPSTNHARETCGTNVAARGAQ